MQIWLFSLGRSCRLKKKKEGRQAGSGCPRPSACAHEPSSGQRSGPRKGPSRAPRRPSLRSGASGPHGPPQPSNELPRRPHKEAHVAKGSAERRLLCTRSSPTAARRGPFPGRPPQPRSGLETRQSPRPAAPPAREAAGPAAQLGAPGPTAAPRTPPPPPSRGPHLRGELQAARGFPGPSAAASRRL